MESSRKTALLWMVGMLFVPPAIAFFVGMVSGWTNEGTVATIAVYCLAMIAMAVGAARSVVKERAARVAMFFTFLVGMAVLQCAVAFVGCSILLGVSSIRS